MDEGAGGEGRGEATYWQRTRPPHSAAFSSGAPMCVHLLAVAYTWPPSRTSSTLPSPAATSFIWPSRRSATEPTGYSTSPASTAAGAEAFEATLEEAEEEEPAGRGRSGLALMAK